ncbi:hypothetical protein C5C93_03685 [Rathayibacter toxicus]|uniref:hypothetical protein n=1 Tax=Rathayibacter toxicus TaxID=145458 RepID=UPI000CE9124B|nr:hypothetical protein [Rathayibacter toxicus]PPH60985.1 hypothetical protein C5C93_03685 [Rathayibacter toxicus]
MTSEHNKEKAISLGNDWTIDMKTERGIERRTIVQGATWTIPAAALAVATPAFAASPQPTLAFTQSSYTGIACKTITGVQVKRTADGTAPDPGKTISVTLANGYTFADGTTTYSGTTDANGLITLPDIKVPAKGGNSNFSASSDSLAASAPVTTPATPYAYTTDGTKAANSSGAVPANSTAIGDATFLAPNGDLYNANKVIASNVSKATFDFADNNAVRIAYVTTAGVAHTTDLTTDTEQKTIPANSTPIGDGTFLAPNGDLYYLNASSPPFPATKIIASNVSKATFEFIEGNGVRITYVTSAGVAHTNDGTTDTPQTTIPANSTPIGDATFLAPNGDLYNANKVIASNVSKATFDFIDGNGVRIAYVTTAGVAHTTDLTTDTEQKTIPANSTPHRRRHLPRSERRPLLPQRLVPPVPQYQDHREQRVER